MCYHQEVVKLLPEKGADVNADNDGALRWVAYNSYLEVVKLLLEKGANVHVENDYALRWVAVKSHLEVVNLLHSHIASQSTYKNSEQKQ
jgi:ankyrin repeat protein